MLAANATTAARQGTIEVFMRFLLRVVGGNHCGTRSRGRAISIVDFRRHLLTDDSLRVVKKDQLAATYRAVHRAKAQRFGKFFRGVACVKVGRSPRRGGGFRSGEQRSQALDSPTINVTRVLGTHTDKIRVIRK
jgi:hypothetical protein